MKNNIKKTIALNLGIMLMLCNMQISAKQAQIFINVSST